MAMSLAGAAKLTSKVMGSRKSSVTEVKGSIPLPPRARKLSVVTVPETLLPSHGLAIRCMIFLCSRPMLPNVGSLLIAVENGHIQVWTHHASGGFLTEFNSVHMAGDYAQTMCTDEKNEYLFVGNTRFCSIHTHFFYLVVMTTANFIVNFCHRRIEEFILGPCFCLLSGTTTGYIKTWLMKNYCTEKEEHLSMPYYRLIFPFLWKDVIEGRAKRTHRGQTLPILLNSFKAHRAIVTGLVFVDSNNMLIR